MKRIILSLLMVFVLTISVIPGFAADVEFTNETDGVYMTPVTIEEADGNVTVSMSAKIPEGGSQELMFIAALYKEKTLTDVEVQTLTVDANKTDFSVTIANVSGEYEINAALVSPSDNLMPKGTPANYPAKSDAASLRDLKINGESVFDKINENNEVNVDILGNVTDYSDIDVMPYTMDSSSVVSIEDGTGEFPDRQILTVTDTSGNSTNYTILYKYRIHYVVGAETDDDFEVDAGYTNSRKSKTAVATVHHGGNGLLYANFHELVGTNKAEALDTKNGGDTGSRAYPDTEFASNGYSVWKINEDILKGGWDYFNFNCNWAAKLKETTAYASGYAGNILEFELAEDATVAIITSADIPFDTNGQGYTETHNSSGVITLAQSATGNDNLTERKYEFMYTKAYKKGDTVAIPYDASTIGESRCPFVVIIPSSGESDTPVDPPEQSVISGLNFPVSGMTYEQYCDYAGETVIPELVSGSTGTNAFSLIQDMNLDIGSFVGGNTQRKIDVINDDTYGITGCEYIRFNNTWTYNNANRGAIDNWITEAYSGVDTTGVSDSGEPKDNYGFVKDDVVWGEFTLTEDCKILVISAGNIPVYETKGYKKTSLETPIIETLRTNGERVQYKNVYERDYSAGDTVEIYNLLTGFTDHIIVAVPSGGTDTPVDPPEEPTISELTIPVFGMTYEQYCDYAGETVVPELVEGTTKANKFDLELGTDFNVGSLVGPNDQRKVDIMRDDFGLTGCDYIRFCNFYTYNKSDTELGDNWMVEAYSGLPTSGIVDGAEAKDNYGFVKDDVIWGQFTVTKNCNIVIVANREIPIYEAKGYTKTIASEPVIETIRYENPDGKYSIVYQKEFSAGDTVEIYNCITGWAEHVIIAVPTGE